MNYAWKRNRVPGTPAFLLGQFPPKKWGTYLNASVMDNVSTPGHWQYRYSSGGVRFPFMGPCHTSRSARLGRSVYVLWAWRHHVVAIAPRPSSQICDRNTFLLDSMCMHWAQWAGANLVISNASSKSIGGLRSSPYRSECIIDTATTAWKMLTDDSSVHGNHAASSA